MLDGEIQFNFKSNEQTTTVPVTNQRKLHNRSGRNNNRDPNFVYEGEESEGCI